MPELKRYHAIHGALHIGCLPPAAYFIPFESAGKAAGERENSAFFTSLCGEWDFHFYENIARVELEESGFPENENFTDKLTVPGNWQLALGRGYDVPNYINQDYPYPVDPPFLPDVIPCGLYKKQINIAKKADKDYILYFEGVSSCFYLWINGTFTAYSQVSHSTSAIDISDYLKNGENTVYVLAVKHCDGSYMEDQDFFRLSGIFREVYILEREKERIEDIRLIPSVSADFSDASLNVEFLLKGAAKPECVLLAPNGERINPDESGTAFSVNNPALWNPEQPVLYRLLIKSGDEYISLPVGFKRFEIVDSAVLLNGVKVKARGINRHDSSAETGYWVSPEKMLEELYLLKKANVNCIRTSHYPNDPRFLEMCDTLGFMVVDEADLESHGMGYNFGDWYWDYWAFLCDSPDWREDCVDRAARLYERDKNHVSVIMWSLGNESGCGDNHRAMAQYIRQRDKTAVIHYENAHLEYEEKVGRDFSDISDVESRMYASIDYLKSYLADPEKKKPFFYCEYVDSMSTGEIAKHWDEEIEGNDKYFGGCVWEFCDHAVNIGTAENPKYRYGGDFGDWPNDNICCVDGIVHPNRTPRPGYYDMKKAYEPFKITLQNGKLTVKSKRFFTALSDLTVQWSLEKNGKPVFESEEYPLSAKPGECEEFEVFGKTDSFDEFTTLNVYVKQGGDTLWAEKGYEVGFKQFVLSDSFPVPELKTGGVKITRNTRTEFAVACGETEYVFDRVEGSIISVNKNGEELLADKIGFSMWHPVTYNSRHLLKIWERARYDNIKQKTYSTQISESDGKVIIKASVAFASAAMPPAVKAEITYTFFGGGKVNIDCRAVVTGNAPELPRFGLDIRMPEKYGKTEFFGFGPYESYADRFGACRLSMFKTTAEKDFEPYVKPQESNSHYACRYASVKDEKGRGLSFYAAEPGSFCFKAIPYSDKMIHSAPHFDELQKTGKTFVSLDYKINSANRGEGYNPERIFDEKSFDFSITVCPE